MSLFEWLGESYNPGNVGAVDVSGRDRGTRPRMAVLASCLLSCVLLGCWTYALWSVFGVHSLTGLGIAAIATLIYSAIAYHVHPQPDMENIGWLGGVFDHPFRYSDDINRFLIFLVIILWPGRFIAESIVDTFRLLLHACERDTRAR